MKTRPKTNTSKKHTWHPKRWMSGERAKNFRRQLGATASNGKSEHVFTFKFPLAAQEPSEQDRDALRLQYEKLASIKENSLFHFFAAIHLAGFRLFASCSDAGIFLKKHIINESDFNRCLVEKFNLEESAGSSLIQSLAGEFRKQPTQQKVMDRLLNVTEFTDAKPRKNGECDNQSLHDFLQNLARRINEDRLFKGDATHKWKRLGAACEAALEQGWRLPTPPVPGDYKFCIVHDKKAADFLQGADLSADGMEYAMHQLIAYAAHMSRGNTDEVAEKQIKTVLLSDDSKYNALSWLFNPDQGLEFFAETPEADIRRNLHVDGECHRLEDVQRIAQKLRENQIQYHDFRSLFGGNIASYISNYWKRLDELREGLTTIQPENTASVALRLEELKDSDKTAIANLFAQTSAPVEKLDDLIGHLIRARSDAMDALESLKGNMAQVAGKREVQVVETFNEQYEECRGMAMQLAEVCRRHYDRKQGDFSDVKNNRLLPEWLLPQKNKNEDDEGIDATEFLKRKLNRYRGAEIYSPDEVRQRLAADAESLRRISEARDQHWKKIERAGRRTDMVSAQIQVITEQVQSDKRLKNNEYDFLELACRNILQRMARAIRDCDSTVRQRGQELFANHCIFKNPKDANKFFINRQGSIYVSPFNNRRHDPYKLGTGFDGDRKRAETTGLVTSFAGWVKSLKKENVSPRDLARLEKCLYGLRTAGLQDDVPAELARPEAGHNDKEDIKSVLSASLRLALENNTQITPGELGKIFNVYASKINGLCTRLTRERFIVKARLQYIDDKTFYWLPKAGRDWTPPRHVLDRDTPLARGWKHLSHKNLATDGKISGNNLAKAVTALSEMKDKKVFGACLRQMPHDWYFKVGGTTGNYPMLQPSGENQKHQPFITVDTGNNKLDGLVEVKQGKITLKKGKNDREPRDYIRLTGPSRFKGWLDKALPVNDRQQVSFGDTSLIMEEEYHQSFNNHQPPQASYQHTSLQAAVVFKVTYNGDTDGFPWNKFIAIDLGERGIGYAVFEVPENAAATDISPTKTGHVAIPVLRHLIRRVDTHRQTTQPRQRFQSNLNTALQQMRETAIGELAGVIDALMDKHRAFPVFESSVSNFESGGKQLKMVYGSIMRLYTFSNTDAHKTKRANHWLSRKAPQWEHETLKQVIRDTNGNPERDRKDAIKFKPLRLFPGTTIHPAGTSQTCSEQKQNPLDLIEQFESKSGQTWLSNDHGIVCLGETRIYLYGQPEEREKKIIRRRKENPLPAFEHLMKNKTFSNKDELKKHIKSMLRHKPSSLRSRDTTQSSYLSPFVETQRQLGTLSDEELQKRNMFRRGKLVYMHADVNAAINIGRKWWKEKISPGTP